MNKKVKIIIALTLTSLVWLAVLLRLGIWRATATPEEGHLSRTFDGWATNPPSRHLFLAQIHPDDFEKGRPYTSVTYPFIFSNFVLLAPFHFLLHQPYSLAHNFLPYFYVACLTVLLILSTRRQLRAISRQNRLLLWGVVFVSIGIVISDPMPWSSMFNGARDNSHVLVAGAFCYLSTWVFYDRIPKTPLLVVGIFLALWVPMYLPAWILASLFFRRSLRLDRRWFLEVVGVCALGAVNAALPVVVSRWAGMTPNGSGLFFRSGLDGSQQYMTSIFQAVYSPVNPRHWSTGFYVVATILLAGFFHYYFKNRRHYRPVQQAFFLLIPYATVAIFLPQLTSIHAYLTDLLLLIPATFMMAFWFLQKPFWDRFTGKTYVIWLLVAGAILMTNLLNIARV
jgi:hypothetical protein